MEIWGTIKSFWYKQELSKLKVHISVDPAILVLKIHSYNCIKTMYKGSICGFKILSQFFDKPPFERAGSSDLLLMNRFGRSDNV